MGSAYITRKGSAYKAFIRATGNVGAAIAVKLKATGRLMASGVIGSDGRVNLAVRQGGTYTVTATSGSDTSSTDVNVINHLETYDANVVFWDGTIYEPGKHYDEYTGGYGLFGSSNTSTAIENAYGFRMDIKEVGPYDLCYVCTKNKVSLSGFKKINFLLNSTIANSGVIKCGIAASATPDNVSGNEGFSSNYISAGSPTTINADEVVSADIGGLDSGYIGCSIRSANAYGPKVSIKKIWLSE